MAKATKMSENINKRQIEGKGKKILEYQAFLDDDDELQSRVGVLEMSEHGLHAVRTLCVLAETRLTLDGHPRILGNLPQLGPYLLPRVPLPSHIPVWRTGGRETEESSVRGLGASHLHCSGSRAGLGSPPKPGRSRRRPRSLRCRRRGACSSSPCERRVAASAQARPMGPGGGRERVKRGARRQQRPMERGGGAGPTQRPLAATRGRAAWREGSGGGTAQWRRVQGAETIDVLETLPTLEDVTVSTQV
ncbi:uncharacterized protein LOC128096319 [Peromyscus californicus insignis]|uniref:uncharacterized protein LOC128096319 n=1 Tax=Peromyscus californicus insignis TaxID=564181 RepID=UPI0022A672A1|nr:uncharacterized protein LOC128096319 [Peromyscus californicus insignis]